MPPAQLLIDLLVSAGVSVRPGLSEDELRAVEARFALTFAPEHRGLLTAGLPAGDHWPDWRSGPEARLREWLDWPGDGLLFDVRHSDFWPASWGRRPSGAAAEDVARQRIARLPRLVPVFGHRFTPAAPTVRPAPVFSVHQSDVIYYGADLADYFDREFNRPAPREPPVGCQAVTFWSDLAEGVDEAEF